MNYVDSFYNFVPNDGTTSINELFSLQDNGAIAKYNCEEFKNIFSGYLNESNEYMDDESLNEAHSYYEMSMLAEARSSWGETDGDVNYIDAESHVILIKNSEAFVIEKKTFDMAQNINEWNVPSLDDIRSGFNNFKNKVVKYAKEKIDQGKKIVKKAWDKITDGAKKAWEWTKTAVAASLKFVGDNIETITLLLSVLSAIFGIAGAAVPGLTVVAGILMAINGGLHIYEGFHKAQHAREVLKNIPIDPMDKLRAGLVKAGPDIFLGLLFIPLGFYDISHGLTEALANPGAGAIGIAVKESAKKAGESWLGSLGHTIEKVLGGFVKKFFTDPKYGAQVGKGVVGLTSVLLSKFFTDVCGWLYEFFLKAEAKILKGISWLLDVPKKLTEAIDTFSKSADGVLTKILAKGLNSLVKPMTSYLATICEKYFKPLVEKAKKFIQRQIAAKKILDAEMEKEHGGHGKGADSKKHVTIPKTSGKPLFKIEKLKADKKDAKYIKKLPKINKDLKKADIKFSTKQKVKESQVWENKYIQGFNDLNFI